MGRSIVSSMKTAPSRDKPGFTVKKLEEALERGYILSSRPPGFKTKKSFAPSSIGYQHGTCPRYWHLAFSGVYFDDTPDAVGSAVMASGTAAHERIQKALEAAEVVKSLEEKAELSDPPVFGYIDLILDIDGQEVVGEIKTTGTDIFRYRASSGKPAAYHLYQVLLYMHIKNLDEGFLMYEDRDSLSVTIIRVKMNAENKKRIEDALEWMRKVRKNWEAGGEIPHAPWTARNKACRMCPIRKACWDEGLPEGSKEIGAMEVVKP